MNRRSATLRLNALVGAWLLAAVVAVLVHRWVEFPVWLMVHTVLLGAGSTAILIWSQHFADAVLRSGSATVSRSLVVRVAIFTLGAVLVATGRVGQLPELLVAGSVVLVVVGVWHAISLGVQVRASLPAGFAVLVRFYVLAGAALVPGVIAGAWLARSSDAAIVDRLFVAHVSFTVLGWMGLTVLGTLVLLWPTVLSTRASDDAVPRARRSVWVLAGALALIGAAVSVDAPAVVAVAAVVWLLGMSLVLLPAARIALRIRATSFAAMSIAAGTVWFAGVVVALGVAALTAGQDWAALGDGIARLAVPVTAGFLAQVLLGALAYLIPVMAGRGPRSRAAAAVEFDRAAVFRVCATNAGLAVFLLPLPSLVSVGVSVLVLAVLASTLVLAARGLVAARRGRAASGEVPTPLVPIGMPERPAERRPALSGQAASAASAIVLVVALGIALDPAAAGIGVSAVPSESAASTGQTTTVAVSVVGMRFSPSVIEVPAGDRLVIEFTNDGSDVHDLTLANGATTGRLAPGGSAVIDAGVIGADIQAWCSVAGHRQMGMVLEIRVTGESTSDDSASAADGHSEHDHGGGLDFATEEPADAPVDLDLSRTLPAGADPWDAALAPATGDPAESTVHRVRLTVTESVREVAPGVTQRLWSYNGQVPGPVMRGRVGDVFEVTLLNDGSIGHSIDFHAGALAPAGPMRTILPGEELVYRFTAVRAGIWMYHCSTMPMSTHIANGLFGAVIIDPPDLEPAREYLLVQNEFYLGPQGGVVDSAKLAEEDPDLVVFNGYANQYRDRPLPVEVGERVRVWVLAAGPNRSTSFHVVGGQFDSVWAEGAWRLRDGGTGGAQSLGLFAAQGGFVELSFPEPGDYPFVNHQMVDAERGAFGLFRVSAR